jgi:hypothetical protein
MSESDDAETKEMLRILARGERAKFIRDASIAIVHSGDVRAATSREWAANVRRLAVALWDEHHRAEGVGE